LHNIPNIAVWVRLGNLLLIYVCGSIESLENIRFFFSKFLKSRFLVVYLFSFGF